MRAHTLPLSEIGETGVTRVTTLAKHSVLLAFSPVTCLSAMAYIRCNVALACNTEPRTRLLWATVPRRYWQLDGRWLHAPDIGRGTGLNIMPEALGDD